MTLLLFLPSPLHPPPPPPPVTSPTPTNPTLLPRTSPEEGPGGPKVCNFCKGSYPCKGSQLGGRKPQVTNPAGDCPSPPDYAYAHEHGSWYLPAFVININRPKGLGSRV